MRLDQEDLQQIRHSVNRYLNEHYSFEQSRQCAKENAGLDPSQWDAFAEMGLFSLLLPDEMGGLGGTPADIGVVMEEFGRALVTEPFSSLALPMSAICHAGTSSFAAHLESGMADGSVRIALAHRDKTDEPCEARQSNGQLTVDGTKMAVPGAPLATHAIISAKLTSIEDDPTVLVLLDLSAPGVSMQSFPSLDGSCAANVTLSDATCLNPLLAPPGEQSTALLDHCLDVLAVMGCVEAVGCMDALVEKTVEFSRSRRQFDTTLSSFQVLQHRMVDMKMAATLARSISHRAALSVTRRHPLQQAAVSAACVFVARESRKLAQDAIQIHGAIGITDELDISHYAKRLLAISFSWMEPDTHLARYEQTLHPGGESTHSSRRRAQSTLSSAAAFGRLRSKRMEQGSETQL